MIRLLQFFLDLSLPSARPSLANDSIRSKPIDILISIWFLGPKWDRKCVIPISSNCRRFKWCSGARTDGLRIRREEKKCATAHRSKTDDLQRSKLPFISHTIQSIRLVTWNGCVCVRVWQMPTNMATEGGRWYWQANYRAAQLTETENERQEPAESSAIWAMPSSQPIAIVIISTHRVSYKMQAKDWGSRLQRCALDSCQCSKFQQTIGKRHSNAVCLFASLRPAILIESSALTATQCWRNRTAGFADKWQLKCVQYDMKNTTFFASSHTHTAIALTRIESQLYGVDRR